MGSRQISIKARLQMQAGVTLQDIWGITAPVHEAFGFPSSAPSSSATEVEFGEFTASELSLVDHTLELSLDCWGQGQGVIPDAAEELLQSLAPHLAAGGAVEIIDTESSPECEEAIITLFVGPTDAAKKEARLQYGLDQARPWLSSLMSAAALGELFDHAAALVAAGTGDGV